MKKQESIYDLLSAYLEVGEDSINVLDKQIDSDTQLEYFEYSKNLDKNIPEKEIIRDKEIIFDKGTSLDQKKNMLVRLASVNDVEAYRTIERFLNKPSNTLSEWAYIALQESRLLLESKFLEENKVLISTGLGGKDDKLRYFIVFFTRNGEPFSELQQRIITCELNYEFRKYEAEIEDLVFEDRFASILTIIPIKVPVQKMFGNIIRECNEIGSFLFEDYIITNVKVLSIDEIKELLAVNSII
ncbi:MAG: hypothetical protein JW894_08115 [Bacteroidales bacterium]|nr:hypothetical protein [Bacteroidales bacterium]